MKLSNTAVACVPYYFVDGAYWVPAVESGVSALLVICAALYSRRKRAQFQKDMGSSSINNKKKSILLPKYDIILWTYGAVFVLQLG